MPSREKHQGTYELCLSPFSPPIPPRIYGQQGGTFLKARPGDSQQLAKKCVIDPIWGDINTFSEDS